MSKLSLSVAARTPISPRQVVSIAAHKAERKAIVNANTTAVRDVVSQRGSCECCLGRAGQSMHEWPPKGRVGNKLKAVTMQTCMWVCGSGTTGCHGHLQKSEILTEVVDGVRTFAPNPTNRTQRAAKWLEAGYRLFDEQRGERRAMPTTAAAVR